MPMACNPIICNYRLSIPTYRHSINIIQLSLNQKKNGVGFRHIVSDALHAIPQLSPQQLYIPDY